MIAKIAINESIPFLKLTDKVHFALDLFEEFKLLSLPVVNEENLYGIVTEEQLLEVDKNLSIDQLKFPLPKFAVNEYIHIFDVMRLRQDNNFTIIPVIDEKEKYIGLITLKSLLDSLNNFSMAKELGGIFVLEIDVLQYSLSEISRIVESNKAKILSIETSSVKDDLDKILVTVKVNTLDLSFIIASMERYEYTIVSVYHKAEQIDQLKERYDALMHYINI